MIFVENRCFYLQYSGVLPVGTPPQLTYLSNPN
jgi:hypothetical protein